MTDEQAPLPNSDAAIMAALSDVQALAGTMYAEAAGDISEGNSSVEERIAVGCVLRNRLQRFPSFGATVGTFAALCLAHSEKGIYQFDCWQPGSGANHARLLAQMERLIHALAPSDPVLTETLYLAQGVMDNVLLDRTNGATFYFAPHSMVPLGSMPSWAKGKASVARIGSQLFYRL